MAAICIFLKLVKRTDEHIYILVINFYILLIKQTILRNQIFSTTFSFFSLLLNNLAVNRGTSVLGVLPGNSAADYGGVKHLHVPS